MTPNIPNKTRCQSCAMPIDASYGNLGTQQDGTASEQYCHLCFANGQFTRPEMTLEQMIQLSIDNMVNQIGMPLEQAEPLARQFIPTLARWAVQSNEGHG